MNRQVRNLLLLAAVVLAGVSLCVIGCEKKDTPSATGQAYASSVALCTKCGQIAGSDLCCKPDAVKCDKCGLAKGSPGRCNIPKGAVTAAICTKCGQIAGSDLCCKPGAEKCEKCGLVKGSPGCCRLPKI